MLTTTQKILLIRKYIVMYNRTTSKVTKNTIAIMASLKGL